MPEAARIDPKNAAAFNAQGQIWRRKGDIDKAIAAYDRGIAVDERPALGYRLRAEAYIAKGDRKRAYADIAKALGLAWSINGLRVRGTLRLEDGDFDGAIADANGIFKIEAENRDAYTLRGTAYARKKDYDAALADLDKVLTEDSKDASSFAERGQVYFAKNDTERALIDFTQAIALGRGRRGALSHARCHLQEQGRHGEGNRRSRRRHRTRARSRPMLISCAPACGRPKAIPTARLADLNDGLSRQPGNIAALLSRAQIKESQRDTAGAIADYDAILAREAANAAALRARVALLMDSKNYARAAEDYDRLIQLDPRNAQTYYLRGLAREQNNERDKAVADYKLALARDRNMADAARR